MQRGYVKLWRKTLDSGLVQSPQLLQFFVWSLLKAAHKPRKQAVGSQIVELAPGQFVFGRKAAAAELATTERKIRTCVDNLKKLGFLTIKTTNKYSVITIANWGLYQDGDQQDDQQTTSNRPATDQQPTTNKNVRKKECKKKEYPENLVHFVRSFQEYVKERSGRLAPEISGTLIESGCKAVDLAIRKDGFSLEEIKEAMRWATQDEFWSKNCRSLGQIRTKGKNGLTKLQNIVESMSRGSEKKAESNMDEMFRGAI